MSRKFKQLKRGIGFISSVGLIGLVGESEKRKGKTSRLRNGNNFRAWGLGFGVLHGNGVVAKQTKENSLKGRQKAKGDSLTTPF